jgi:large subunit ribosomal protein L1
LKLIFLLNIDPKYANQQLRTSLVLPNGTGKLFGELLFLEAEYVVVALEMGITIAGLDDLIEEINSKVRFQIR